jgi:hypothetical protein
VELLVCPLTVISLVLADKLKDRFMRLGLLGEVWSEAANKGGLIFGASHTETCTEICPRRRRVMSNLFAKLVAGEADNLKPPAVVLVVKLHQPAVVLVC